MNKQTETVTDEGKAPRIPEAIRADAAPRKAWVREKAYAFAVQQGYGDGTAKEFTQFAIEHCPEVQGFSNLFDYYMIQKDYTPATELVANKTRKTI